MQHPVRWDGEPLCLDSTAVIEQWKEIARNADYNYCWCWLQHLFAVVSRLLLPAGCTSRTPWERGQFRDAAPRNRPLSKLWSCALCPASAQPSCTMCGERVEQVERKPARFPLQQRPCGCSPAATHALPLPCAVPTADSQPLLGRCPGWELLFYFMKAGSGWWSWAGGQCFSPWVKQGRFLASLAACGKLLLCRALGGRPVTCAGSPDMAAATAEIPKTGLNVSGWWGQPCCVPKGPPARQLLSVAHSRKGAPGMPPQPLPHFQGLWARASSGSLRPSPHQMPMGRLTGCRGDVFNRCISEHPFVPETGASPAASYTTTCDVAAVQKHFSLRLFFYDLKVIFASLRKHIRKPQPVAMVTAVCHCE